MKKPAALVRQEDDWILNLGDPNFDHHLATSVAQEKEEDQRKLYVALTRAANRLYLGMAPVTSTQAARHKNAASDSALVQLPGLGLHGAEMGAWLQCLRAVPEAAVLGHSPQLKGRTTQRQNSAQLPHLSQLAPPQSIPSYKFSTARTASFTSLSKSDQDHSTVYDRYDESDGDEPSGEEKYDLLQPLGKGGAALGDQLHHLLEEYLGNHKELAEILQGVEKAEVWCDILQKILAQPISLANQKQITLEAVRRACITEMQFYLPVGVMSRARLSDALLADHALGQNTSRSDWANQIRDWAFHDFTGFFQGYIDLIFEHENRWYVVDYKSNLLDAYDAEHLESAMLEKNYLLQARLYALALERHLKFHLPEYNYETHFGGVIYLFVRGFPSQGVWFERPSCSATVALGTLFANAPQYTPHS
jgi:exodeoxyribonuclease V beta subunit